MSDGLAALLHRARHGEPQTCAAVGVLVEGAAGLDSGEQLRQALERIGLTDVQLWAHGHTGLLARLEHNRIVLALVGTDEFAREVLDGIEHEPPSALWPQSPLKDTRRESHKTVLISTDAAAQGAAESSRHPHLLAAHGNMNRVAYDLFGDELTWDGVPLRETLTAIRDAQPTVPAVLRRRSTDASVLIRVHDTVRGRGGTWLPSPTVADGIRPDYFARLADGRYVVLRVSELLDPTESEAAAAATEALSVAQVSCAQLGLAVFAAERISPPVPGAVGLSDLAAALAPR